MIEHCKHLISRIPQTWIRHIFKEANKCADFLTKLGTSYKDDFMFFQSTYGISLCVRG